jgi:hypothetical protein
MSFERSAIFPLSDMASYHSYPIFSWNPPAKILHIHSANTTISPSSFASFPTELIHRIFQFADDFSTVAALAKTSRIFYYTWRECPEPIYQAVAPRSIMNFADAERLLSAQDEARVIGQGSPQQKTIIRVKRLLENAEIASFASNTWIGVCRRAKFLESGEDHLIPMLSELSHFIRAYYRFWALGIMSSAPHLLHKASALLNQCSSQELHRVGEVGEFFRRHSRPKYVGSVVYMFCFEYSVWETGRRAVLKHWKRVHGRYPPSRRFKLLDRNQR